VPDYLFTSESVSEGHPDKIADRISDAILDALLAQDADSRVACETFIKTGLVLIGGEITTKGWVDVESIARKTIKDVGYAHPDLGFDGDSCAVLSAIGKQSADIALGVDETQEHAQGAGDQGIMFGYATDATDVYLPAPIAYAHRLMQKQAALRKSGKLAWLRPDAKSQVTMRYEDNRPVSVDTVLISTQHDPNVNNTELTEAVIEEIIKPCFPADTLKNTRFLINPTGRFVIGGPVSDCGLTGRKIIVDTYGGMARHGGGCFSGKDPSKVDRSAAYACRYVAKNLVAAGIAKRCEVQLSYAIGMAEPTSIYVNTFGTGQLPEPQIIQRIQQHFDLTPKGITQMLDLKRPIYEPTACYGHFGREDVDLPWERLDKVEALRA